MRQKAGKKQESKRFVSTPDDVFGFEYKLTNSRPLVDYSAWEKRVRERIPIPILVWTFGRNIAGLDSREGSKKYGCVYFFFVYFLCLVLLICTSHFFSHFFVSQSQ